VTSCGKRCYRAPSCIRRTRAGLGHWHPHELRHSAVSLLSASGVSIELVADVMGHSTTRTTEAVYRHSVLPTAGGAAQAMDYMFPED
jgi:integrase